MGWGESQGERKKLVWFRVSIFRVPRGLLIIFLSFILLQLCSLEEPELGETFFIRIFSNWIGCMGYGMMRRGVGMNIPDYRIPRSKFIGLCGCVMDPHSYYCLC